MALLYPETVVGQIGLACLQVGPAALLEEVRRRRRNQGGTLGEETIDIEEALHQFTPVI
jgi:hypothetical protein